MNTRASLHKGWWSDWSLFEAMQAIRSYGPSDDRTTGQLYERGVQPWSDSLTDVGPGLLRALHELTGVSYPIVHYQAYLDGAGCDWHRDTPFDAQAVLSLGLSRDFAVRPIGSTEVDTMHVMPVSHGDVVVMPSGFQREWEHCVPRQHDALGERISLVFRTPA